MEQQRREMTATPLWVQGFGRRYSRRRPWAVRDVSFELPAGSITALVGPNGAGKSTIIRACVGFERPDEGRVLVLGADPQVDRPTAVNSIGYVPQAAALYRRLSIGDHLVLAAAARTSFDRPYATQRIADAGLTVDRRIADLSGGEQAQVSLALALGTRAPLLLLDEPLASLDPLARRDFLSAMVTDVRGRGATALLSSHIVTDVEQACDRLVVLGEGTVRLDVAIPDAVNAFTTARPTEIADREVIGAFLGPDGQPVALANANGGGRPASLEEIVLGHLAAGRKERGSGSAD